MSSPWLIFQSGHILINSYVNANMSVQIATLCVSFVAFVALERPLPCVRSHMVLQVFSSNTIVVAMVALVRLLSCVFPHHVLFQLANLNAGKLARFAAVRFFTRVDHFVSLQMV